MTREEAIARIKDHMEHHGIGKYPHIKLAEALNMDLSALRPVSRERVEEIKGVWIFNDDWWEFQCSECHKGIGNIEKFKFCPHCGARMDKEDEHDVD